MSHEDLPGLFAALSELVAAPAPVGSEEAVANVIAVQLNAAGIAVRRDALGNLHTASGSRSPRVLVVAHMDQVGFMISRVGPSEAHCLALGAPDLEPTQQAMVRILGSEHRGQDGMATGVGEDGAILRADKQAELRVGDRLVFGGPLETGTGDRIHGPALDNRIGCLVAVRAARELAYELGNDTPGGGVAFAWTVREETDHGGVVRAVSDLQPQCVVVVDVTPATTDDRCESDVVLGAGPAITLMDEGLVAHGPLLAAFAAAADARALVWQPEVVRDGTSEAGTVSERGVPALALLVPVEGIHTPRETADLRDVAATVTLLVAGLRELLA